MANSVTNVTRLLERPGVRWAAVAGLVLAIFGLRLGLEQPVVGVGLLYMLPVAMAGFWFGRRAALATGLAATGLYVVGNALAAQGYLVMAAVLRLVVFCSVGYAFALVVEREGRLRRRLSSQEDELAELRALRAALVPPRTPERPAIDLATCFVPAQERVAGDFFFVG